MIEPKTRENLFKIIKIIDKAMAMEKHAQIFYRSAADFTESPEGRKMFNWLAEFEESHVLRLAARKREILENPIIADEEIPEPDETDLSEARDIAGNKKFADDIEVLKIALENERRAYAFYTKKATLSEDQDARDLLDKFAQEEDKHIRILDDQLHSLKMNKIYKDFEEF